MLSFRLNWRDVLASTWRWDTDRWVSGQSWLCPVINPTLEHAVVRLDTDRVMLVIRERVTHRGQLARTPAENVTASLPSWPGDYLSLELTPTAVTITAGARGTAPVYVATDGDTLHGSWDIADFQRSHAVSHLGERGVVRVLTRRHRYSTETVHADIHRITERTIATWTPSRLTFAYPEPVPQVAKARTMRDGVDPVSVFDDLLTNVIARTDATPDQVAVELSGGVDSGNVTASVVDAFGRGVDSYGLIVPGPLGKSQQRRRQAYVQANGLIDAPHPAQLTPPFTPWGPRGRGEPHDPAGDFYAEAFDAARAHLPTVGIRVVFTGFGGDEITALRRAERGHALPPPELPPWLTPRAHDLVAELDVNTAPVAPIPLPSLLAFAARSPLFLRRGLWPVSPLANPTLAYLTSSLPTQWRQAKRLLRERLRRRGLPQSVVTPRHPEDFTPLMAQGLQHHGLPLLAAMTRESILVDAGYLDPDELASTYWRCQGGAPVPSLLYDTIALEVGLRSLIGQPVIAAEGKPA